VEILTDLSFEVFRVWGEASPAGGSAAIQHRFSQWIRPQETPSPTQGTRAVSASLSSGAPTPCRTATRRPGASAQRDPSSRRDCTARPDTPSHPGRAAVEKSTRAYSPVDRSSPEEPAARILG